VTAQSLHDRVAERIREWRVIPGETRETDYSYLVFGRRDRLPVVLKVIKRLGDEWHSGAILTAFDGIGMVRVREFTEGALLLDRLCPGHSLCELALEDRDEEATEILASVIQKLAPRVVPTAAVPVRELARGFQAYLASGDRQIATGLVERAQQTFVDLCESQSDPRLLHGDLHHYNVLYDEGSGWLAIDPKGLVGELEYEIAAALRNPYERLELIGTPEVVERRLRRFERVLALDGRRALRWSFAQAVLAAIWTVEEGVAVTANDSSLVTATAINSLLQQS